MRHQKNVKQIHLCKEYRDRYPSDPVEPTPPCETVEPGTLCEDEGEASTPICNEGEILVNNRCETQEIQVNPIYPDQEPGENIPDVPDEGDQGQGGEDNGNEDSNEGSNEGSGGEFFEQTFF